jgi:hypothetical protein
MRRKIMKDFGTGKETMVMKERPNVLLLSSDERQMAGLRRVFASHAKVTCAEDLPHALSLLANCIRSYPSS